MRAEFSKATKRAALRRSGGVCEAVGEIYGLFSGARCETDLSRGVEFDHRILEANSHDNSLENCLAVCPPCHRHKTTKHDIPLAAKTLRQQDKHLSIRRKTRPMPGSRASGLKKCFDGTVVRR